VNADLLAVNYPLVIVTGRFQPFHNQHLELMLYALRLAERVIVGITNAEPGALRAHAASPHRHLTGANPYSFEQRRQMILAALTAAGIDAKRVDIRPFPLEDSTLWPEIAPPGTPQLVRVFSDWEREKVRRFTAAGYPPLVLTGNAAQRISGSAIRAAMQSNAPWQQWVPAGARECLLAWREIVP
jgi:cytidyltransferase-like protein